MMPSGDGFVAVAGCPDGDGYGEEGSAAPGDLPPRRAGDAAGAVLRPGLRAGDHAVHEPDVGGPDLGRDRTGAPDPGAPLVVLGRLRLADQRPRPRGGRG